jgi:hypothetical protein
MVATCKQPMPSLSLVAAASTVSGVVGGENSVVGGLGDV